HRGKAVQPDFTLTAENGLDVARLCQHLEGMPLAIELAAARLKMFALPQILAKLESGLDLLAGGYRTTIPRQQSVTATITWSYQLLHKTEQHLFRRLSILVGFFGLDLVEALWEGSREEALETLRHLIDKSLVIVEQRQNEACYRMLETIR